MVSLYLKLGLLRLSTMLPLCILEVQTDLLRSVEQGLGRFEATPSLKSRSNL